MAVIVDTLEQVQKHLIDFKQETNQPEAFLDVSISNSPRKTFVSGHPESLKAVNLMFTK